MARYNPQRLSPVEQALERKRMLATPWAVSRAKTLTVQLAEITRNNHSRKVVRLFNTKGV